jgi:two-component system, chemotaxis family, CheB/CheR fusion protein
MSSEHDGPAPAPTSSASPDEAPAAPVTRSTSARSPFPIVGVGASAGGIEALKAFFTAADANGGLAYVVIQHLSPEHQSLMADILGRCTSMPVVQIEDGQQVEPDHVYVIRPGFTVTLKDARLHLGHPVEKRGHRRPVDDFFRSLAREQQESAIGVILSGTGTNGSAGAQAIKAVGGLCIAQDPDSAEFPGMPLSLIHSGYADHVLAAGEIPAALQRYVRHPFFDLNAKGRARAAQEIERHRQDLGEILAIIRSRTGHEFAQYKPPTILRRINRRMGLLGVTTLAEYAICLREKTEEVSTLTHDLMINVTGFFRDPEAWEALREAVIQPLVAGRSPGDPIRAWVTACASGEEAYSLAILISEEAERLGKSVDIKIFATDTADKSLALARAGIYPGGIEGDLSTERLEKFFERGEQTYRVSKVLRDQIVFAPQDVLRDPPFSRVDIVTCRNLLIYLEPEAQRRVLALTHFALREGGYLFLGNAETVGPADRLFESVSKRWRIYRRLGADRHSAAQLPALAARTPEARPIVHIVPPVPLRPSPTAIIQAALLDEFGPPSAVVDANERIVYFHGDATPYLQVPQGESTQNFLDLVRPALRPAVRQVLRKAVAEQRAVSADIESGTATGRVTISAAPLKLGRPPDYFRVSFQPSGAEQAMPDSNQSQLRTPIRAYTASAEPDSHLEEELRILRRELQTSVESFEAANEELKASNEEVTSINEELQSANEELETSKEELQALNEELVTVNSQLQTKLLELEALTDDLDNLLSSTNIAVVFLDTQLKVRRFTPAINDLLELLPGDIGRPLAHLAQKFSDGDLIADAASVLARLTPMEAETLSHSGRWYLRHTLPYRTEDNRIAGVVITFVEITVRKKAEQSIEAAQARLQAAIEQMPAAVLMIETPGGKFLLGNRLAAALFEQPYPLPLVGQHWSTIHATLRGTHPDGRPFQHNEWPLARTLADGATVMDEGLEFTRTDGSRVVLSMSASPIRNAAGDMVAAIAAFWNVTERKRTEAALRDSEARFRMLVESAYDFAIFMLDEEGRVVSWNQGAERVTGHSEVDILGKPGALLFTPEDRTNHVPEDEIRRAAESGRALDERWHMRKDGTRFWASGVLTVARDVNGVTHGFVKVMRDQTERKETDARLQEALRSARQLRARAEGANRAKDEFISTVSHELRTPLNTIRLWSRIFVDGKVQAHHIVEGGKIIDRAALAQQQLIDDLLDVSRMASGQLRLAMRDTMLIDAVEAAVETIHSLADGRRITLTTDLSDEVGIVHIDPDRIQQVVWNLLANAVKFTPEGGRVHVRVARVDGTVEIEVRDTGIGIHEEFLPHVFDRFRQAEQGASRRFAGLGLGLSIAKQLIELQGGTVTARSEGMGRGATFTVYLPLERRLASDQDKESILHGEAASLRGADLLLVEDETAARAATHFLLEQRGATVRSAQSAAQARQALTVRRPDAIIADIGMPDEDGYAFLRALRRFEQEQGLPPVPAVAVTAFARPADRDCALGAGFNEHLSKPVDPDELVAVLAQLIQDRAGLA